MSESHDPTYSRLQLLAWTGMCQKEAIELIGPMTMSQIDTLQVRTWRDYWKSVGQFDMFGLRS